MYTVLEPTQQQFQFRSNAVYPFFHMETGTYLMFDEFRKAERARVAGLQFVRRHALDWKIGIRKSREGWMVVRLK